MKRLVCIVLCAALALSMTIPVFAEDVQVSGDRQTGQSTLTYDVESSFTILIPQTIDLNTGYQFHASYMNLESDLQVSVYCTTMEQNDHITMTNAAGDSFGLILTGGNGALMATFDNEHLESDYIIYGQPEGEMPNAGQYSGIAEFEVRLELKPQY